MRPFEYTSPTTYGQAVGLLDKTWGKTAILAGGTDLLSLMKDDIEQPARLVNIKSINEGIMIRRGGPSFVAMIPGVMTIQAVADHSATRQMYPALAEACDNAASPQIRNVATIAGNLCQRPRCWYFRSGFGLLAMKDGKSLVEEGDNRYHAIFGNDGPAKFVSPSSIAPVLIAYGATITIVGADGKSRRLALDKFFVIPKVEGEREHALAPNEVVAQIMLPAAAGVRVASYEIRQKDAFDWPLASAAVALTMAGANVKTARIVLGHVAPIPWVSEEAAQALVGKPINGDTAEAAAGAAISKARPLSRNGYKIQLARVAVKRAILKAAKGGQA